MRVLSVNLVALFFIRLSGVIDGNNLGEVTCNGKITKFAVEIQNYYRDEKTKEKDPSERTGQIRPEVTYRESPDTAQQETDRSGSGGISSQAEGGGSGIDQSDNGAVKFSIGDGSPRDVAIARDTYERMLGRGCCDEFHKNVEDANKIIPS